ncbi:beta-1,2-xylosyltransferase XYXT1-like isoform X2 [Oryza brachyantha]|uniref:beta-1,2-xylosyltransferase XYXT1-like isoform X2 n=1 Tax=Oryza brachyantha TaxID=4533 RepID=UPI0003EAE0C4|nr:beta-1,2-xylosyltransferase XYXT1-like isoform X2 [Oryza brachyantha]
MGSPKTSKSSMKQGIWRRRIGAPFAAVLVAAVLAVVVFSGQFAKGPNASSQFAPVQVDSTLRPRRDKPLSTDQDFGRTGSSNPQDEDAELKNENEQSPNKEEATEVQKLSQAAGIEQDDDSSNPAPYTKCTTPSDTKICDLSNPRFDICELCGDARTVGQSSTVVYVPQNRASNSEEWSIRAQSRKHIPWIKKVTIKSVNSTEPEPKCTSKHHIPAIVFALGGLTANVWHDFSDVLIPLFLTARQFNGDVQLVITNNQPWFIKKYSAIFSRLTRHEIIDFDADNQVRCYPHVIVGLRSHRDLGIDPSFSPQNYTMVDFRLFVREAYGLPSAEVDIPYKADKDDPDKKPRIMLIDRGKTRKLVNAAHVEQGLDWFGFEVVKANPKIDSKLDEFVRLVDSCDAIMGVHGAGLTNMVFLRSRGVVVHIVPYGIEFMADGFYGAPARDMGLRHVQYNISAEESTLLEKYGWNHTVINDPETIRKGGWEKLAEFYMSKQDIMLNMTRFGPSLLNAIEFIM